MVNRNYYKPANKTSATQFAKPKQKRWYVDAAIPRGIPFIGGSTFKAGSGTLQKRSIVNAVKQSLIETKQKITVGSCVGMLHNTCYTHNFLGNIPVGTGSASRIGQTINVLSCRYTLEVNNVGGSAAALLIPTYFRFICFKSRAQAQQSTDSFSSGIGSTDIFESGSQNLLMSKIDYNKVNLLSDKVVKLQVAKLPSPYTNDSVLYNCDEVGIGKMEYLTPTSNYGKVQNVYMVVIPYTPGGSTGTTVCGNVNYEGFVAFQDTR